MALQHFLDYTQLLPPKFLVLEHTPQHLPKTLRGTTFAPGKVDGSLHLFADEIVRHMLLTGLSP